MIDNNSDLCLTRGNETTSTFFKKKSKFPYTNTKANTQTSSFSYDLYLFNDVYFWSDDSCSFIVPGPAENFGKKHCVLFIQQSCFGNITGE